MLGHRGCRLGIVYPEITAMQARAIFEAACLVKKEGIDVQPEVMIPLAGFLTELQEPGSIVRETAEDVFKEKGIKIDYLVGTMIEIPAGRIVADQIAKAAEFFSFGTNDLTQTTLGMSRDDYGGFIGYYQEHDIIPRRPVPNDRQRRRRRPDENGRRTRPQNPPRSQDRHLRRTRRRPGQRDVLPRNRPRLRQLLPFSSPHRPPGRRASRIGEMKDAGEG